MIPIDAFVVGVLFIAGVVLMEWFDKRRKK